MKTTNQFAESIKRGFLLWSWVTLFGGYIATSSVVLTSLQNFFQGEYIRFVFRSFLLSSSLIFLLIPILLLFGGWFSLYRYSILLYRFCFLDQRSESESSDKSSIEDKNENPIAEKNTVPKTHLSQAVDSFQEKHYKTLFNLFSLVLKFLIASWVFLIILLLLSTFFSSCFK